jgi:uncharacterized protein
MVGVVVLVVLAGAALLVVALAWRASTAAMHPAAAPLATGAGGLAGEAVTVASPTGAALAGRFYRGRSGATVVLSHGYGGTQDELAPVVSALQARGLSVFTYDLRGCGGSTGAVTFGALESLDLGAVVDHVASRTDVDATRIGAYGFSMGGATTLLGAASDPRIRAVVADSAWAEAHRWLRPSPFRLRDRFSSLSLRLVELRAHVDLGALRPTDVVEEIAPRPLLVVHGDADEVVWVADARELAQRAGDSATLWIVPGAAHGATVAPGGAASSGRVADFFERSLAAEAAA